MWPDLIFLHASHTPECRSLVDKHFDGYYTLQYATAGALELFYGEDRHELRCEDGAAWFWTAYPGPRIRFHLARDYSSWNHRYVAFTGTRIQHWKDTGIWPPGPQLAPRGSFHAARFDELLAHLKRPGDWARRRATHTLEDILLELAESRAALNTDDPWLMQTWDFLESCRDFIPDYARLARDMGIGLSTLRRRFKASTGISLHEAYLQVRLEKARRLLVETDLPLKTIAARLHYRDVFFFSSQFKNMSGVTPTEYRRSRQL